MKLVRPSAILLSITPDAEQLIEEAGRTCYKSEEMITDESADEFIRMIKKRGHESVLEHASASFRFVCNRGVTHEMVRHRLCGFSQESTRFCNYGKDKFGGIDIINQDFGGLTEDQLRRRWELYEHIERVYLAEVEEGIKPQIARDNLPICLKTEIVMTCNLREWCHVLKLRTSIAAHPQIKQIMTIAGRILKEHCPNVFHDFDFGEEDYAT